MKKYGEEGGRDHRITALFTPSAYKRFQGNEAAARRYALQVMNEHNAQHLPASEIREPLWDAYLHWRAHDHRNVVLDILAEDHESQGWVLVFHIQPRSPVRKPRR